MPKINVNRIYYKIDDNNSVFRFVDDLFKRVDHVIQRYGYVVREPMGATVNLTEIIYLGFLFKLRMIEEKSYR